MFSNFIMLNLVPIRKGIIVLLGTCVIAQNYLLYATHLKQNDNDGRDYIGKKEIWVMTINIALELQLLVVKLCCNCSGEHMFHERSMTL